MPKTKEQCDKIKDAMRTKILDSSLVYFAKNGFYNTKISDLAKYIGIGQGTLYCYFSSKEEVLEKILEKGSKENQNGLENLKNAPISAAEKIMMLSKNMVKSISGMSKSTYLFALNAQVAQKSDFNNPFTKLYEEAPNAILADIIRAGQKEGSVVEGDADILADLYWSTVHVMALHRVFNSKHQLFSEKMLSRQLLKDDFLEGKE